MSRHDRWLLIRLAAQNVGRRRLRAMFLGAAVMLGVGIAFASFVAGWALWQGMAQASRAWAPISSWSPAGRW
jgi:putative ABC transport system permease protein